MLTINVAEGKMLISLWQTRGKILFFFWLTNDFFLSTLTIMQKIDDLYIGIQSYQIILIFSWQIRGKFLIFSCQTCGKLLILFFKHAESCWFFFNHVGNYCSFFCHNTENCWSFHWKHVGNSWSFPGNVDGIVYYIIVN